MPRLIDTKTLSGFYRLRPAERIERLIQAGVLASDEAATLSSSGYVLARAAADRMIENVVGVFGLPLGLVTGVVVDDHDYIVPFVVEEPSIVAAASSAAKLAARHGGFRTKAERALAIGQIELRGVTDGDRARQRLAEHDQELCAAVDAVHPNMVKRGGGIRRIDVRSTPDADRLVVHIVVDTCDAMGANLINSQCEAISARLAELAGATAGLRILSNYCDEARVTAIMRVPSAALATRQFAGEAVRDAIVAANHFARTDVYRAVTHNKGVMNGIDPIALATGNDWRAIEAAAHAYAARDGSYRALTDWHVAANGDLEGRLTLPMKVGTVGGTLAANPGARFGLQLAAVESAGELARLMVAVGLGQNFSALRALATDGIQRGHMRLHARSVVASIGVPAEQADAVTTALVASGEIKAWKARELHRVLQAEASANGSGAAAAGKIIIAGEHAVVHGYRAIAVPIPEALRVRIEPADEVSIHIPAWQVRRTLSADQEGLDGVVMTLLQRLDLTDARPAIHVDAHYPPGIGLGGSASLAVGLIRALDAHYRLGLDDATINDHAFAAETLAHGRASGIDNTLAVYGRPLVYQRGADGEPSIEWLSVGTEMELLVAVAGSVQPTRRMVEQVAMLKDAMPARVSAIMAEIDALAGAVTEALAAGQLERLGRLLNLNQGLLNSLGVSTAELESLCQIARDCGAYGAKLTGGGGGGAIIAVCDPETLTAVRRQFEQRSIQCFAVRVHEAASS
ncbi:MAG: hydroxymethylglutaryl-CoA reductase, degradative [Pseudomonadota bacterium]